ncbi:MAG: tRNA guanosine(15) transglycosylase TgtA [Candidatus Thalassarchaeaceae archaeon]|nr:tRNA guanosine(15) transglycosylase TgtA [Candidatus Thalassarchaeaceae archaeon]
MGSTFDTTPCREQDLGKFEILERDGVARIGRLFTKHGTLQTPMLLPVVNPNIRTIEPREMWDEFGVQALITNSYVIWKHEKLKNPALKEGVHKLLDFPGIIVTDSGTFQSYVYGDIDVGVEEIVAFQRDIGVDIGTMLDVFGRPDQSIEELKEAVEQTVKRALPSLVEAGSDLLLNGPIQGGLHTSLRSESAELMGSVNGPFRGFSVHPIGGIVPIMEQHRYLELARIILAVRKTIPVNRPIHMFGCGHPMLFPMCIALGVDLFDSAAYALFARDGRLLTPDGTVRIENLKEWPFTSRVLNGISPSDVRAMEKNARTDLLARYNLEATQAELARCREAVRSGKIWSLVEQRSHSSPELREAFLFLKEHLMGENDSSKSQIVFSSSPVRPGSERWTEDSISRPHLIHANRLIRERWTPPLSDWKGESITNPELLLITSGRPPWRDSVKNDVIRALFHNPSLIPIIQTPNGLLPFDLEDWAPLCHIQASENTWSSLSSPSNDVLKSLGFDSQNIHHLTSSDESIDKEDRIRIFEWLEFSQISAKCSVLLGASRKMTSDWLDGMTVGRSSTGRIRNVFTSDGRHVLSPRLHDGGISLTNEGAKDLHSLGSGTPRLVLKSDAIPYVQDGRNVIHGFIEDVDENIAPGLACLIQDSSGNLIAHGISRCLPSEIRSFSKGIAVRVRGGIKSDDSQ